MANVRNITDLPVAESTEGLNLIVNDNGVAKQIAAENIGGTVKSVNGAEPDENGNIQIEIPEGGSGGGGVFVITFNRNSDAGQYESITIDGETVPITYDSSEDWYPVHVPGLYSKVKALLDKSLPLMYVKSNLTSEIRYEAWGGYISVGSDGVSFLDVVIFNDD